MSDKHNDNLDKFLRRFALVSRKKQAEVIEAGFRVLEGENTEAILYSAAKAGRILDYSPMTIYRLRKAGILKPVYITGRPRYRRRDLLDLANNGVKLDTGKDNGTNS